VENEVSTPASRPPGRENPTLNETEVVMELDPKIYSSIVRVERRHFPNNRYARVTDKLVLASVPCSTSKATLVVVPVLLPWISAVDLLHCGCSTTNLSAIKKYG
jgi:hypothetical protein